MSGLPYQMTASDAVECIAALDIVLDQYRAKLARMRKPSPAFDDARRKMDYVYQVKRRLELQQPIDFVETKAE
jgi:hypothetical protein